MSDLEVIIYILAIAFYLFTRIFGGKKQSSEEREPDQSHHHGTEEQVTKERQESPSQGPEKKYENLSLESLLTGEWEAEEKAQQTPKHHQDYRRPTDHREFESGGVVFEDADEENDHQAGKGQQGANVFSRAGEEQRIQESKQQTNERLQEIQEEIKHKQRKFRKTQEKEADQSSLIKRFQRDDDYRLQKRKPRARDYYRYLRNKNNLKQAFVVSEILKRKF